MIDYKCNVNNTNENYPIARVPAHSLYFGSFMKNAEIEIFVVLGDYKNNYKKIMV